jgi:hypothetical protein
MSLKRYLCLPKHVQEKRGGYYTKFIEKNFKRHGYFIVDFVDDTCGVLSLCSHHGGAYMVDYIRSLTIWKYIRKSVVIVWIIAVFFLVYFEFSFHHVPNPRPRWVYLAANYIVSFIDVSRGDYNTAYQRSLYSIEIPMPFLGIMRETNHSPAGRLQWFRFFIKSLKYTGQGNKIAQIKQKECVGYQEWILRYLPMFAFMNREIERDNLYDASQVLFKVYDGINTAFCEDDFLKEMWEKAKQKEVLMENAVIRIAPPTSQVLSPWVMWWPSDIKWDTSRVDKILDKDEIALKTLEEYHSHINRYLRCLYLFSCMLSEEGNILAAERMWQKYLYIATHDFAWSRSGTASQQISCLYEQFHKLPISGREFILYFRPFLDS